MLDDSIALLNYLHRTWITQPRTLTNTGVRGTVEKPHVTDSQPSISTDSANSKLSSTGVFTTEKNLRIPRPMQFHPMLSKGQLYSPGSHAISNSLFSLLSNHSFPLPSSARLLGHKCTYHPHLPMEPELLLYRSLWRLRYKALKSVKSPPTEKLFLTTPERVSLPQWLISN